MFPLLWLLSACGLLGGGFTEGPELTCADPSLRQAAPFEHWSLGEGWDTLPDNSGTQVGGAGLLVADLTGDGLLDVLLPNRGPEALFIAQGDGTFVDESEARWDRDPDVLDVGATAADYDGDGDLDVYITTFRGLNGLYQNDGQGYFSDVTDAAGVGGEAYDSVGSAWGDYDQDGDLDLWVGNHREDLDLFVGLQEGALDPADPNVLYRNRGDGTFGTVDLPAEAEDGFTYHSAWVDLDGDGDLDLLLVNDFGPQATPNQVLWNQDGQLVPGDDSGLGVTVYGMGAGLGDVNGDGVVDVLVSSWGELRLLESAGDGTWYDSARSRGLVPDADVLQQTAWGGALEDVDADGDLDLALQFGPLVLPDGVGEDVEEALGLIIVDDQADELWLQQDDGSFEPMAQAWGVGDTGVGRGGLLVDLDGDGWLDWLKREIDGPPVAWRARCGDAHWVSVRLDGEGANPDGIGAQVVLEAGGQSWQRTVHAGSTGVASGGPPVVHFGLGQHETIDSLVVTWPDGEQSTYEGVGVDRAVTLER